MKCRWLINANWFCVLCRLTTNSRTSFDRRHFCSEWRSSRRVSAQYVVFSKIDEAAKARTLEEDQEHLDHSTWIRSTREFHDNSWKYRSLSCECSDVFLSTTLIFVNQRLEMIDRVRHWWKCVQRLCSFRQTFSRCHHDRSSLICEEKVSRRRSKSCFVEDRLRFELRWDEKEEKKRKKTRRKKCRKKKKRKKRKKKKKKKKNDDVNDNDEKNHDVEVRIVQIVVNKQL